MKGKIEAAAIGVAVGVLLKLFVVDILCVRGTSMESTLTDGQRIMVSKLAYGIVNPLSSTTIVRWKEPQRGDVVVFAREGDFVVKRCAGVAGDGVELCCDEAGEAVLKVAGVMYPATGETGDLFAGIDSVPYGMIVVIGDNTDNSSDSRSWGFLAQKDVLGKVIIR